MKQSDKLKSSLGHFLRTTFDLMVLNWLWLLCSLPVVTMGPATCGLYAVALKLVRDEPVQPLRDFFRGFRDNFKAGLVLSLVILALAVVAAGDVFFALQQTAFLRTLYLVVAVIISAVLMICLAYGFALQARFVSPVKVHLANAFRLAFVAPGRTIALWAILLLPVILFLILPPVVVGMLGFVYVILGISGPVYLAGRIQRNVFDRVSGSVNSEA